VDILLTLETLVTVALLITVPLAIYDRFKLQPIRLQTNTPRPELFNQVYELIPLLLIGFFMIFYTLEAVLTVCTAMTAIYAISAKLYLKDKFNDSKSVVLEQIKAYVWLLIIIWLVRSFLIQPYVVPTGSLEPTILPGDFIVVNQFSYGFKMPISGDTLIHVDKPKNGDIALFRWPKNRSILYIKRVIGVPGDHIIYRNKQLHINGKLATQVFDEYSHHTIYNGKTLLVSKKTENLLGYQHKIQQYADLKDSNTIDIIVPEGQYFMMGDNRDDSSDSRFWGMVPEKDLIGKATYIWLSIKGSPLQIRWNRIGSKIL
jgi:signal peptidase I